MAKRFLEGRAAIVTGGASGIGRAIALGLAQAGADVAIGSLPISSGIEALDGETAYFPSDDELEETRRELASCGVRAVAIGFDVCSDTSVEGFVLAATEAFGKIDILVNAAGIGVQQRLHVHDDTLWHKVIDVCLNGPYRMMKRCLPGMYERRWGRIVNISSNLGSIGMATEGAYCAAKHGLIGLTRAAALEGAPYNVTCNALKPHWADTKMARTWIVNELKRTGSSQTVDEYNADIARHEPQKRLIPPEEIAALAVYLCHDEALAITGADIPIDGASPPSIASDP